MNKDTEKTSRKRNKIALITLSLIVAIVGITLVFNKNLSVNAMKKFRTIASALGAGEKTDENKGIIDKSISDKGYTITIKEVILDKDELIITSTLKSNKGELNGHVMFYPTILINEKRLEANSNGIMDQVDKSTVSENTSYKLSEEYSGEVNIKINYSNINIMGGAKDKNINGSWDFEFTINADELAKDTIELELNDKIETTKDEYIILKNYKGNSLGASINYEKSRNDLDYSIMLKGKDNFGNYIEFYPAYDNLFKLDDEVGKITKDTTKLKLYAYKSKSLEDDTWEKVGKEIVINIK